MEELFFEEFENNGIPTTKMHESTESSFEIPDPFPPHTDPSLCRDKFLKTILGDHNENKKVNKDHVPVNDEGDISEDRDGTAEGLAIQKMIAKKSSRKTITLVQTESGYAIEITLEEHEEEFKEYVRLFQKSAIEFVIVRTLKQLHIAKDIWPGDINEIPHKLFCWSVDYFLQRIFVNQMYLDVVTMERCEDELDCIKFRTDVNEIVKILCAIRDDFSSERDICLGAIAMINGADYQRNSKWIKEVQVFGEIQEKLVRAVFQFHGSAMVKRHSATRQSSLQFEDDNQDAITPIELRYRIRWVRSDVEQDLLKIHQKDEFLERQLADTVRRMSQDALSYHYTEFLYSYQIQKYRNEINEWQRRYDNDFESVDFQCIQTSLALEKIKDEYKFYADQLVTMKRRIAEVTELIRKEKEHRENEEKRKMQIEVEKIKALEAKRMKKAKQKEKKEKKEKKKAGKK